MENFKIVPQHKISKTLILFAGDSKDLQKLKDKFPDIKSSDIYPVVQTEFDYQFFFYTVDDNDINNIRYTAEQLFKDLVPLAPKKTKSKTLVPGIISLIILFGLGIGYKVYEKKIVNKNELIAEQAVTVNSDKNNVSKQTSNSDRVKSDNIKEQTQFSKTDDEFKITYVEQNPEGIEQNYRQPASSFSGQGKLKVIFVDVGQADAAIVITPSKKTYVIDTGRNNSDGEKIISILNKMKIKKIDTLILTHPHADHIGGGYYILKNFKVNEVWDSGKAYSTRTYKRILTEIKKQNIKYKIPVRGDKFDWGDGIKIKILNPQKNSKHSTNNYSIVIHMQFDNYSFMFTGDMEKEVEHELVKQYGSSLKTDILKVCHHGSHSSSTKSFLDLLKPKYFIIMVGAGNKYGHPHSSTYNRLQNYSDKIYRTDIHGNIYFETDGKNIKVKYDKKINFISFDFFNLNKEVRKIG